MSTKDCTKQHTLEQNLTCLRNFKECKENGFGGDKRFLIESISFAIFWFFVITSWYVRRTDTGMLSFHPLPSIRMWSGQFYLFEESWRRNTTIWSATSAWNSNYCKLEGAVWEQSYRRWSRGIVISRTDRSNLSAWELAVFLRGSLKRGIILI